VINVTFFKKQTLVELVKQVPQFEEAVWRHSLPILCKIFFEELKPLCFFSKTQIRELVQSCELVRLRKD
jgi:hypothetical protein